MVTTKQSPIVDIQKINRKESSIPTENHQSTNKRQKNTAIQNPGYKKY